MTFSHPPDALPSGTVLSFFGTVNDVPQGWVICDGNNGTDDLRDKYVRSVNSTSDTVGSTGGSNTITISTSQLPPHSHTGTTGSSGSHDHTYPSDDGYRDSITGSGNHADPRNGGTTSTTTSGSHTHGDMNTGNSGAATQDSVTNEPKYHETTFIEKL